MTTRNDLLAHVVSSARYVLDAEDAAWPGHNALAHLRNAIAVLDDYDRDAEYRIAQRFHEEYERLAPMYAWTTQEASAVPWEQLPDNQRRLMCDVVENLRAEGTIGDGQSPTSLSGDTPQPATNAIGAERNTR